MNDFLFLAFKVSFLMIFILGLTIGVNLLKNYKHTMDLIFSKEKPKIKFIFQKTEDSDRFVIYYFARLLAICVIVFFLIIIFQSFAK